MYHSEQIVGVVLPEVAVTAKDVVRAVAVIAQRAEFGSVAARESLELIALAVASYDAALL